MEPQAFGKYLLVERIAQGGMAEVYRAVVQGAAGVEKTVALKRILPVLDCAPEFVSMFIDEARIAASLTHVNVAQVFEFGEVRGSYYLAMELIEGVDLGRLHQAARRRGVTLPHPVIAFLIAEAARGLAYAHDKRAPSGKLLGIVHRDVSPQNILVSYAGEVKIADFGIAKAVGKLHKTDSGAVMGKLKYMSPEQITGEPLDGRSDVFSLGIVLWELLTGRPLFDGDNPGRIAELVKTAAVPVPSSLAPVPPELDRICLKALARSRDARHERAQDLARELSTFVSERAPGLTREDVGALVSELVPREGDSSGLPDASSLGNADTAVAALSPTPALARSATQPARRKDAPVATPTERGESKPRSTRGRAIAALALVGGAAALATAGLVIRALSHGGPETTPGPLGILPAVDAGAASTVSAVAPARRVDPIVAARLSAELDALPLKNAAWRGVPAEDYRVLLSAVESTVCGPELAFPEDLGARLDRLRLRGEATAVARYFQKLGELEPRVADAFRAFLRGGRPSFSPGERGWAAAALASVTEPSEPRYLLERMRENTALGRWRERGPDARAPGAGEPAAWCDREALLGHYAERAPGARADALKRYLAALPLEMARETGGIAVSAFAPERDEAAATLTFRLHIRNTGAAEVPLAQRIQALRLTGLESAPAADPGLLTPLLPNSERDVQLRFSGFSDAAAEAAVVVVAPGVELRVYSELL